jgi:hypothetical protein
MDGHARPSVHIYPLKQPAGCEVGALNPLSWCGPALPSQTIAGGRSLAGVAEVRIHRLEPSKTADEQDRRKRGGPFCPSKSELCDCSGVSQSGLVGEAAQCAGTEIDGAGRQMPRVQVDTITEDDGLAARERSSDE